MKSFPAVSGGFEIETEMSVHASQLKLPVSEIALDYGRRPEGSASKLSTYSGRRKDPLDVRHARQGNAADALLRRHRRRLRRRQPRADDADPDRICRRPAFVPRMPTWVLSLGMLMFSAMMVVTGLILDPVSRGRAEQKRIFYLSMPGRRPEARGAGTAQAGGQARILAGGMNRHTAFRRGRRHRFRRRCRHAHAASGGDAARTFRCASCLARLRPHRHLALQPHATFGPSSRGVLKEGARYGGVGITTSIVNYLVYGGLLLAMPWMAPLLALVIASLVAMTFSYLGYSRLVFDR